MEEIPRSLGSTGGNGDWSRMRNLRPIAGGLTVLILRVLVGLLFIYAGISKALNPDGFVADIGRFELLPEFLVLPVAIYLPYLEVLTGLALITGIFYFGGLLLTKGMLLGFSAGLASAWWRGLDITCGCFGQGLGDLPVHWALFRNGVLFLLCVGLAFAVIQKPRSMAGRINHPAAG